VLGTVEENQVGHELQIAREFHLCRWRNRQRYLPGKFIFVITLVMISVKYNIYLIFLVFILTYLNYLKKNNLNNLKMTNKLKALKKYKNHRKIL